MDMVSHQHIGMQGHFVTTTGIFETIKIEEIILLGKQTGFAVVSALDHMTGNPRHIHTWLSWHRKLLLRRDLVQLILSTQHNGILRAAVDANDYQLSPHPFIGDPIYSL